MQMHIISGEIILSHCYPMSKISVRHLSCFSFRSSPQVPICKTHDWSKTKQAITALTASINHLPSGIRAEEEEIKGRKTNSNFLAQMFYQQNQKDDSQYCLLFLVCAACDMALQENSSPSKMYLVNPLCIFISRRKRGLLCMQVLNGIRLLQVSVSSLLGGRGSWATRHGELPWFPAQYCLPASLTDTLLQLCVRLHHIHNTKQSITSSWKIYSIWRTVKWATLLGFTRIRIQLWFLFSL